MAGVRITQQGPQALPMRRYGSFAGKTAAGAPTTAPYMPTYRRRRR